MPESSQLKQQLEALRDSAKREWYGKELGSQWAMIHNARYDAYCDALRLLAAALKELPAQPASQVDLNDPETWRGLHDMEPASGATPSVDLAAQTQTAGSSQVEGARAHSVMELAQDDWWLEQTFAPEHYEPCKKAFFDAWQAAEQGALRRAIPQTIRATILRALDNDFTNAVDNRMREEIQKKRMPFDHDNNDALKRCLTWESETEAAISWLRSATPAEQPAKEPK